MKINEKVLKYKYKLSSFSGGMDPATFAKAIQERKMINEELEKIQKMCRNSSLNVDELQIYLSRVSDDVWEYFLPDQNDWCPKVSLNIEYIIKKRKEERESKIVREKAAEFNLKEVPILPQGVLSQVIDSTLLKTLNSNKLTTQSTSNGSTYKLLDGNWYLTSRDDEVVAPFPSIEERVPSITREELLEEDENDILVRWTREATAMVATDGIENINSWVTEYIRQNGLNPTNPVLLPNLFDEGHYMRGSAYERVDTIGGGTCLIHAILLALSPAYRSLSDKDKEDCGNVYRLWLAIRYPNHSEQLKYTSVTRNPDPTTNNKWSLDKDLDMIIGTFLLTKLECNIIVITNRDTEPSRTNNNGTYPTVILYGDGTHFELVKKKKSLLFTYPITELVDINSRWVHRDDGTNSVDDDDDGANSVDDDDDDGNDGNDGDDDDDGDDGDGDEYQIFARRIPTDPKVIQYIENDSRVVIDMIQHNRLDLVQEFIIENIINGDILPWYNYWILRNHGIEILHQLWAHFNITAIGDIEAKIIRIIGSLDITEQNLRTILQAVYIDGSERAIEESIRQADDQTIRKYGKKIRTLPIIQKYSEIISLIDFRLIPSKKLSHIEQKKWLEEMEDERLDNLARYGTSKPIFDDARLNEQFETMLRHIENCNYHAIIPLINSGYPVNFPNEITNHTLLDLAILSNCKLIAILLIENGASLDNIDELGNTSLDYAIDMKFRNVIEAMIKKGVYIYQKSLNRAQQKYPEILPALLANPTTFPDSGFPLVLSPSYNHVKSVFAWKYTFKPCRTIEEGYSTGGFYTLDGIIRGLIRRRPVSLESVTTVSRNMILDYGLSLSESQIMDYLMQDLYGFTVLPDDERSFRSKFKPISDTTFQIMIDLLEGYYPGFFNIWDDLYKLLSKDTSWVFNERKDVISAMDKTLILKTICDKLHDNLVSKKELCAFGYTPHRHDQCVTVLGYKSDDLLHWPTKSCDVDFDLPREQDKPFGCIDHRWKNSSQFGVKLNNQSCPFLHADQQKFELPALMQTRCILRSGFTTLPYQGIWYKDQPFTKVGRPVRSKLPTHRYMGGFEPTIPNPRLGCKVSVEPVEGFEFACTKKQNALPLLELCQSQPQNPASAGGGAGTGVRPLDLTPLRSTSLDTLFIFGDELCEVASKNKQVCDELRTTRVSKFNAALRTYTLKNARDEVDKMIKEKEGELTRIQSDSTRRHSEAVSKVYFGLDPVHKIMDAFNDCGGGNGNSNNRTLVTRELVALFRSKDCIQMTEEEVALRRSVGQNVVKDLLRDNCYIIL